VFVSLQTRQYPHPTPPHVVKMLKLTGQPPPLYPGSFFSPTPKVTPSAEVPLDVPSCPLVLDVGAPCSSSQRNSCATGLACEAPELPLLVEIELHASCMDLLLPEVFFADHALSLPPFPGFCFSRMILCGRTPVLSRSHSVAVVRTPCCVRPPYINTASFPRGGIPFYFRKRLSSCGPALHPGIVNVLSQLF